MLFVSPIFLFIFIPIFYILYFIASSKHKNIILLIGSIVFYTWGEPRFIYTVLISAFLDWILAKYIVKSDSEKKRKIFLFTAVFLNLGLLFYFKYCNFFVDNVNRFFELIHFNHIEMCRVLLPLAISFIVFEKITYVSDVFMKRSQPPKSFIDYCIYVFLFPKLIAGPIIKYHEIEDQIQSRSVNQDDIIEGFFRFVKGMFKKVLIADTMGEVTKITFGLSAQQLGCIDAWLGAICFSMQIYFDFSGYSDMAIGLLRAMGFRIPENFNLPYVSRHIGEFWKRWHISFMTFIKDYFYIPIGGSRCSKIRQYTNIMLCFLIVGMWHSAKWSQILVGVYHGGFVMLDKALKIKPDKKRFLPVPLQIFFTFIIVMFGWIFTKCESFSQLGYYLKAMFSVTNHEFTTAYLYSDNVILFLVLGLVMSFIPATDIYAKIRDNIDKCLPVKFILFFLLLIFITGKISSNNYETFLYFRF